MDQVIQILRQSLGERIRTGPVLPIQRHGKCRFPFKIPSEMQMAYLNSILKPHF